MFMTPKLLIRSRKEPRTTLQERSPPSGKTSSGLCSGKWSVKWVVTVASSAGGSMIEKADWGASSSFLLGPVLGPAAGKLSKLVWADR